MSGCTGGCGVSTFVVLFALLLLVKCMFEVGRLPRGGLIRGKITCSVSNRSALLLSTFWLVLVAALRVACRVTGKSVDFLNLRLLLFCVRG